MLHYTQRDLHINTCEGNVRIMLIIAVIVFYFLLKWKIKIYSFIIGFMVKAFCVIVIAAYIFYMVIRIWNHSLTIGISLLNIKSEKHNKTHSEV